MDKLQGRFAAIQSQGKRDYQEDEFGLLVSEEPEQGYSAVVVVADGMGGHANGAQASRLVTEAFIDSLQASPSSQTTEHRLEQALQAANTTIREYVAEDPTLEGMGSTLVALLHNGQHLYWISVGDSPLWVYRKGKLNRLNEDHSMKPLLEEMVRNGKLSELEASTDKRRHALLSAVTGEDIELTDLREAAYSIEDNDLFLVASDGILTLTEQEIESALVSTSELSLSDQVNSLLAAVEACDAPRQDNITIALYRPDGDIAGYKGEAPDITRPITAEPEDEASALKSTTTHPEQPADNSQSTQQPWPVKPLILALLAVLVLAAVLILI